VPVIVYLDETGDHSLEAVDHDFPIFVLVMLICDIDKYNQQIVPAFYQLKMDFFGHEGVIFHSRDIRKAQGDFGFLTNAAQRQAFYDRVNALMAGCDYTLIAAAIRKQRHKDLYGEKAHNPYDLALKFALERLLPLLEGVGQTEVRLIAEARGKREDDELRLAFLQVANYGTEYIASDRFRRVKFNLQFVPKARNIIGTQMADLAGYPIARHVLNPGKPNPAYELIEGKFYRGPGRVHGLKVFP
jgi:hypothetical protein